MARRSPSLLAAVVPAVVAAVVALAGPPASAQATGDADDLFLSVSGLTGSLSPGDDLEVHTRVSHRGDEATDGLRLVGTLHSAVASRFALQRAVDDGRLGAVVDGFSAEIAGLQAGGSATVELTRSAAELGFRRADQFGVYPLRLQLLEQGQVVDELRTALVFTAEEVTQPIRTALLLPVTTDPLLTADGVYDHQALRDEFGQAGRVQGLVGSLAARAGFPATLAPDALLLDTAADLAGGFTVTDDQQATRAVGPDGYLAMQAARLRERTGEVVARPEVDTLAMPYARADLPALLRGGMGPEAARHIQEGRAVLGRVVGADPLPGVMWPPGGLNPATVAALSDAGVDTLVLSERHLDLPDGRSLSPSPVRELARTRGAAPTLLVPDPWLEEALAAESEPRGVPIAVQRVLAETATVYFERPFAEDVRGLLVAPPQVWTPQRGLAGALMDALDEAPWVQPVSVSRLARTVEPDTARVLLDAEAASPSQELAPSYVAALAEARRSLGSLAQVLAADEDDSPTRFDRHLRAAASVSYRTPPETSTGRQLIAAVRDTVAGLYSAVTIEEGPQIFMEEEGPVPVTVANAAEVPLRVRVRLQSQRFTFAEEPVGQPPDERGGWVIPPGGTRTLTFQATAVTPGGRAPISVLVEDVDGAVVLAQDTLVVRSTAVSIAALVVTVGAGLFLLVWVVRQATRRRRGATADPPDADRTRPPAQAGTPERR